MDCVTIRLCVIFAQASSKDGQEHLGDDDDL